MRIPAFLLAGSLVAPALATNLPAGFEETLVVGAIASPTAMAVAPDGRIFVCQQTGQLRVVDYKTGKPPAVGFEAKAMFQMRFYALALWRMRGEVPSLLQLMYLATGAVLRYEPDEHDLLAMERKVQALWQAIDRAMTTGDWRATPSALCQWCAHQALCPAWGGTPPPLPAVDG